MLVQYDICSTSGEPGPKRREGDRQVPEGVYHINHFNPQSNFHLSLGISYPNKSDKILGDVKPASAIYVHGDCVTIGCLPITDDKMKELYILAVEAKNSGQVNIPVHIFPTRLTATNVASLENDWAGDTKKVTFWKNLQPIFDDFESTRILKPIHINAKGEYHF